MFALIESLGPFHCLFTLSSAEKPWHEVIVAILEKEAHEITELCGNILFENIKKIPFSKYFHLTGLWEIDDYGKLQNKAFSKNFSNLALVEKDGKLSLQDDSGMVFVGYWEIEECTETNWCSIKSIETGQSSAKTLSLQGEILSV